MLYRNWLSREYMELGLVTAGIIAAIGGATHFANHIRSNLEPYNPQNVICNEPAIDIEAPYIINKETGERVYLTKENGARFVDSWNE